MSGKITIPENHVKEPFVDVDDIAEVAFKALTTDGHNGKIYEVSGPKLLSFEDVAQEFSQFLGRSIEVNHVTMEEFKCNLLDANVPSEVVELLEYLFTEVLDGRNEYLTNGVSEMLGRPATSFSKYINKTISTGVWA